VWGVLLSPDWVDPHERELALRMMQKYIRYLDKKYADGLWFQFMMIIQFWAKDTSPNFEKTDEFIEKSTQASFELLGVTAFDSLIDLGKFLIQNKTGMNFQK
jgi:hypothetical protein